MSSAINGILWIFVKLYWRWGLQKKRTSGWCDDMDSTFMRSFVESFNREKEQLNKKFEAISKKIENMDKQFELFDERMEIIDSRCRSVEDVFDRLGDFTAHMDDVNICLARMETRLNQYKTLSLQGQKIHNGELYTLKIQYQKIKPIVNWENNEILSSRFKEIESKLLELEGSVSRIVV